ncbi:MAG: DDE-type integrase/transposase/recombinase [FCB group bacterium]|nr:DDE-type integrase/transposase/recombinase [FCB group bacterium]
MKSKDETEVRQEAVRRFLSGESANNICSDLNRSKPWFYKWLKRYQSGDGDWFKGVSHRPKHHPKQTSEDLESTVINIRKSLVGTLYAQTGAIAIQWEMKKLGLEPLPASTINRILKRKHLINKRQKYEPKGKIYPEIGGGFPGSVHQMDIVGPRYLKNDGLSYSHNLIDAYSHQASLLPGRNKDDSTAARTLIKAWQKMDIPEYLQMDNALCYRGSNRWPRSFGLVIRFCLSLGVQPIFIPLGEPWWQGIIEKFNDVYDKSFLRRQKFASFEHLQRCSHDFEGFHNQNHRYSVLHGKTPNQIIKEQAAKPRLLPENYQLPTEAIPLEEGYIHLIRFIRSSKILDVFGEQFLLQKTPAYEYVTATICVDSHRINVYLQDQLVEEIEYRMPVDWFMGDE